jgi:hypothetical protein
MASLAAALVMFVGSLGIAPAAVASGIFLGMDGSWRGDGAIKYTSGESESMTCVAKNEVSDDGNKIKQVLTCAFASGGDKLKVTSDLSYRAAAGVVVGHWRESSYGVNGQISGTATSTKITAQVKSTSQNLSIGVEVVMNGGQQLVTLRPTNLDVTEARVLLSKS